MKRIVILGVSCSGKSTLSEKLSRKLNSQNIDLDEIYWKPGWIESSKEEFWENVNAELRSSTWVVAGNYRSVQPLTIEMADTIIWLDYPKHLVFKRAIVRSLNRIFSKESCCNGNYESFTRTFLSKKSILLWVYNDYDRKRIRYYEMIDSGAFKGKRFIHLRSQHETDQFIEQIINFEDSNEHI